MVELEWRLSAFADEISPNLDEQLDALRQNGGLGLELRTVGNINVVDLDEHALHQVAEGLRSRRLWASGIGSPVNKVEALPSNHAVELDKLARSIRAAKALGVRSIRIFSPLADPLSYGSKHQEMMDWMAPMVEMAVKEDVLLLHENDGTFYGAYPENARRLMESLGGEHFAAILDFSNMVPLGYQPIRDWFPWLLPHLYGLHMKDHSLALGRVVPCGEGDGHIAETLEYLRDQGWVGTLAMEPHLHTAGKAGGFSGRQLFDEAVLAVRRIAQTVGVTLT